MHSEAVERLEQDNIHDAAEKAWCTTNRAAALVPSRTGEEPPAPTTRPRNSWY